MHLIDPKILRIVILLLLGFLVIVKWKASGSVLDRLQGNTLILLVNGFNLFFLLIVNPLTAIGLMTGYMEIISSPRATVGHLGIFQALETLGLGLYIFGFLLMALSLITLGRHYQLGGLVPRSGDKMVMNGPYKWIRHPMYTAALSISLGLVFLIHSWAYWGLFGIYFLLIILLMSVEEKGLQNAYGQQYLAYCQKTKKLIPSVY
jgi:protein-S-isoprenylcysteine O-methyltransferase Ste14